MFSSIALESLEWLVKFSDTLSKKGSKNDVIVSNVFFKTFFFRGSASIHSYLQLKTSVPIKTILLFIYCKNAAALLLFNRFNNAVHINLKYF